LPLRGAGAPPRRGPQATDVAGGAVGGLALARLDELGVDVDRAEVVDDDDGLPGIAGVAQEPVVLPAPRTPPMTARSIAARRGVVDMRRS
jgi:hypothetical protein